MDAASVGILITSIIAIVSALVGANFKVGKDKATKLALDVVEAVQDEKVTEEECQKVATDVKALLGK